MCNYFKEVQKLYSEAKTEAVSTTNSLVWHYTNVEAAQAILTNQTLRFTYAHCMNDSMEIRHGLQISFNKIMKIQETITETNINDAIGTLGHFVRYMMETTEGRLEHEQVLKDNNCDSLLKNIQNLDKQHFYLSCLSYHNDNLPMHYMYANRAQGLVLGFDKGSLDTKRLQKITKGYGKETPISGDVIYSDDEIINIIEKFIEKVRNWLETQTNEMNDEQFKAFIKGSFGNNPAFFMTYFIIYTVLLAKNKHYKGEHEYRLFHMGNAPEFVKKNDKLIPYYDIAFPLTDALKEIVLSPGCPIGEDEFCLYLNKLGYGDVKVRRSEIPYRNV